MDITVTTKDRPCALKRMDTSIAYIIETIKISIKALWKVLEETKPACIPDAAPTKIKKQCAGARKKEAV